MKAEIAHRKNDEGLLRESLKRSKKKTVLLLVKFKEAR